MLYERTSGRGWVSRTAVFTNKAVFFPREIITIRFNNIKKN
jgi:hypothetical protein